MEEYKRDEGYKSVTHLMMLVSMTLLSGMLVIMNRVLMWEPWMIPVVIMGTAICWFLRISRRIGERAQIYFCGVFLMFEGFSYASNITTVYDCTAVFCVLIWLLAFTGESILLYSGLIVGMSGMLIHIYIYDMSSESFFSLSTIVRIAWQAAILIFSAILADRITKIWKNTESIYKQQLAMLKDENARVNNFLANVSHEIRTPINAVVGLSAVMEKESLSPKVLEHVQSISNAGHRVAEQIGDILDYTEIDMDALSVSDETYMIGSLVNDLIVQISHMESYGLDLVIDMDPSIPCELEGDSSKIKKILWHLIDNSYKFTRDGGVNVRIYTIPREYGVNLLIEVTDTGIGMTEEEIEHIYDKFYQSDSGRSRMAGGLGLGIPIVNGFVRSMGGMLTIESKPDEGTVVRVSIPQGVVDDGPCLCVKNREECVVAGYLGFMTTENRRIREFYIEMIAHLSAGLGVPFNNALSIGQLQKIIDTTPVTHLFIGTGEYLENREYIDSISGQMNVAIVADIGYTGTAGGHATLLSKPFYGTQVTNFLNHAFAGSDAAMEKMTTPGLQALVVDDEPMNLIVAKGIFSSYGMIVSTASGGQEALDMCAVKDYDIVFMDHMMPGMDGVEAMKRLKMQASRKNKELCVVALTANAISTAKEMFLSEGFDGFIPKPVEVSELERVLKHVLPRSAIVYENVMDKKAPAASDQNRAGDKDAVMNKNADDQQAKASIEDGSQDVDAFSQLKDMDVDTAQGLSYCQNDASFYIEVLCEYAGNREKKAAELESYIASEDMENYAIRVHAVKSTSKMIGAMALSEQAKALEAAAKDDDRAYVLSAHIPFLKKYKDLMDEISELYMPGNSDQGKMPEDGNGTDGDNPAGEDEFVLEFGPEDDGEGTL